MIHVFDRIFQFYSNFAKRKMSNWKNVSENRIILPIRLDGDLKVEINTTGWRKKSKKLSKLETFQSKTYRIKLRYFLILFVFKLIYFLGNRFWRENQMLRPIKLGPIRSRFVDFSSNQNSKWSKS